MLQESFEVQIRNSKKSNKHQEDEDECSDITDDELCSLVSSDDEEQTEITNYLTKAFEAVASVEPLGNNEFEVSFNEPNVTLLENEEKYDFDIINDVPYLDDTSLFIPFVKFIKNHEASLIGVSLYTNLEGGGNLII